MLTLPAFLLAIAVLVVFHELGHFWVARWCGVKVLRFSVGFGRVIYRKQFSGSDTEWVISLLPLGGYVKMLDEREGEVHPDERAQAFNRQSVFKRMAIVVAGPVANLLLAIVLYWGLFIYGVPGVKPVIGEIAAASPAASAQFHERDTILSVNGEATPGWQEVRWVLLDQALQRAQADIEVLASDGGVAHRRLDLSVLTPADLDGDFLHQLGLHAWHPEVLPVIGKLVAGGAAERAGLQVGDRVRTVAGQPLAHWEDWVAAVRAQPGQMLNLEIERGGQRLTLGVTPDAVREGGRMVGKIGAAPQVDQAAFNALLTEVRYPPLEALQVALSKTVSTAEVSLSMMGKMLLGEVSVKNLSGPLSIADYAGQSAQLGGVAYLGFLALISISLGVLNLLPVPLLDGGHLLYYAAELLKGSPVSEPVWALGQKLGIALLLTLMAFALYNDVSRLFLG